MGLNEPAFLFVGMGLGGIIFVTDRFGLILCSGLSIFGMILFYIGIAIAPIVTFILFMGNK